MPGVLLVGAIAAYGLLAGVFAFAATPSGEPPPSYRMPGNPFPAADILQGHETRRFTTQEFAVDMCVSLEDAQSLLAEGFAAVPAPQCGGVARLSLRFIFSSRWEQLGVGSFGPDSGVNVGFDAYNSNLDRFESFAYTLRSDPEVAAFFNEHFGAGTGRLANITATIGEKNGEFSLKFNVQEGPGAFRSNVSADFPISDIVTRVLFDPAPSQFASQPLIGRFLAGDLTPGAPFYVSIASDQASLTPEAANLTGIRAGSRFTVGGTRVTILSVTGVRVIRWSEIAHKLLP